MILGTPRRWWIATAIPFLIALVLLGTGYNGAVGTVVGVLLILLSMILFAMAPMRYGQSAVKSEAKSAEVVAGNEPAGPRAEIEARDASDV
jgi:hypothetical protein